MPRALGYKPHFASADAPSRAHASNASQVYVSCANGTEATPALCAYDTTQGKLFFGTNIIQR